MNPQDPLAGLHSLREPLHIGWWPLAPGWWLLLAALLMVLAGGAYLLWRRYRRNAYRRQALLQLKTIHQRYLEQQDEPACISAVNALLKSVAIKAYPRRDVAAISGEAWLDFLNAGLNKGQQFETAFGHEAYRPETGKVDLQALHHCAALWIRQHQGVRNA